MGTNRRVVVVRSPDPKLFEQAIFILREDLWTEHSTDRRKALREAQEVAERYVRELVPEREKNGLLKPLLLSGAVLLLSVIACLALRLLGS